MIDLQLKDLRLVQEAAKQAGLNLSATTLVQRFFAEAQKQGDGKSGTQALFKIVERLSRM